MSVFLGEAFEHEGYVVVIITAPRRGEWWLWVEFEQEIEYGERSVRRRAGGLQHASQV